MMKGCSISETKRSPYLGSILPFSEGDWIPRVNSPFVAVGIFKEHVLRPFATLFGTNIYQSQLILIMETHLQVIGGFNPFPKY